MVDVLRHRLERLACDFDLAGQLLRLAGLRPGLRPGPRTPPCRPTCSRGTSRPLRARAGRVSYRQQSMTAFLAASPDRSADAYVLLDAQDWMTDADLTALWTEITRTARPGARVIFRTAADERCLPGRVPDGDPDAWDYAEAESRAGQARDRSAIYGGFHLYRRRRRMSDAAQAMDRMYRRQRHLYDASRKFYLLGRDRVIDDLAVPRGRHACWRSAAAPGATSCASPEPIRRRACHGLDVSAAMLDTAARSVARAGLSARIRLARGDATAFDPEALFGRAGFDRIVISYALSMIPPWERVLAEAAGHLAPGGQFHVVDFGDQAGLPRPARALLNRWLAAFAVTPRAALPEVVAALAAAWAPRPELRQLPWRLRGACRDRTLTREVRAEPPGRTDCPSRLRNAGRDPGIIPATRHLHAVAHPRTGVHPSCASCSSPSCSRSSSPTCAVAIPAARPRATIPEFLSAPGPRRAPARSAPQPRRPAAIGEVDRQPDASQQARRSQVSPGRPSIRPRQDRMPRIGTTGMPGTRKGRGRAGSVRRSTRTAMQITRKAKSVPMLTSSPSRSIGTSAGDQGRQRTDGDLARRGRAEAGMHAGEDRRQQAVAGHGVEDPGLPVEGSERRRGQAEDRAELDHHREGTEPDRLHRLGDGIGHVQRPVGDEAGEHGRHRHVEQRADGQRPEEPDRRVALGTRASRPPPSRSSRSR